MSKADVFVGIQWGDEGKGRVIDLYSGDYDVVARFGGGDNAGHSIKVGEQELALRIVPSGVLQPHTQLFIGGGTVVSLEGLVAELNGLEKNGVDISRVKVSDRAHVVLPHHPALDKAAEFARGENAIGTTGRGIGPAYMDRVSRSGLTFAQLRNPELLESRVRSGVARARAVDAEIDDVETLLPRTKELAAKVLPHVVDGVDFIHGALESGKRVLVEGAQGTLLDVGYGTYPFVTSSNTISGGACTGLGIGPSAIGKVVGIVKAYCTRVGGGPFPSELLDETGARLQKAGGEFGVVTGRPRRCGWFDAVAGKYAVRLNGLTSIAITKLDVLSGFEKIGIVTGYTLGGRPASFGEAGAPDLQTEIEWHEGWSEPIDGVRRIADLPVAAAKYVARLQELLGVPLDLVSVGPERSQLAR